VVDGLRPSERPARGFEPSKEGPGEEEGEGPTRQSLRGAIDVGRPSWPEASDFRGGPDGIENVAKAIMKRNRGGRKIRPERKKLPRLNSTSSPRGGGGGGGGVEGGEKL